MEDTKEVQETMKAASSYLKHLRNLSLEVQKAQQQIYATSEEAERNIREVFDKLLSDLPKALNKRCDELLEQTGQIRQQSLKPLEACQEDLHRRISKTGELIVEGENILSKRAGDIEAYCKESSFLGSLPEVPELKEVPYISFSHETNSQVELIDVCTHFGTVSKMAPIQICQMSQRPGAILVEWQSIENDERTQDIQEFRLQKAFGNVIKDPHLCANFSDCFIGLDSQFLVKDLVENKPYSFRICCKFEGCNDWSSWSVVQVSFTAMKPYCWKDNDDFTLMNENRIAKPLKDHPSILLSDGPQIFSGCSIEFTFLEFDKKESRIGLVAMSNTPAEDNSFFLSESGELFVNGAKKCTRLPEIVKGSKVCFSCELVNEEKLRINVDSCNKQVTYDWNIFKDAKLYFAAHLSSEGSKITVE